MTPGSFWEGSRHLVGDRLFAAGVSALLIAAILFFVYGTWTGRALMATAQSRVGATIAGVDPVRMNVIAIALAGLLAGAAGSLLAPVIKAFVISSPFAGLAGAVCAHLFVQVLAPPNLLLIEMVLILAMTIVGGLGTLTGPIIGAILPVVMWEIMRDVSPYAHMLLFATLVIVVMKFFRAGIFGLIAARLKARGLMAKAPPLTVEQGLGDVTLRLMRRPSRPDRPVAPPERSSRHADGEDPPLTGR